MIRTIKKPLIWLLAAVTAFTLTFTAAPLSARADAGDTGTDAGFVWREQADGSVWIVNYIGGGGELTIFGSLDGKTVTGIDNYAFLGNDLTKVEIPESVAWIGDEAFGGNPYLNKVTIKGMTTSFGTINPFTGAALWQDGIYCRAGSDAETYATDQSLAHHTICLVTYIGSAQNSSVYAPGDIITTPNDESASGYTFHRWYTDPGYTTLAEFPYTVNADTTFYGYYTANTYTVTYDINGGDGGSTSSSTHTYDVTQDLTANGYYRTGYIFAGWSTTPTGTAEYDDQQSVENLTDQDGVEFPLYAVWLDDSSGYAASEVVKLRSFLNTSMYGQTNGSKINAAYDPNDPSTWTGVAWNSDTPKHVTSIGLGGEWSELTGLLSGALDVSGFPELLSLNCSSNFISSVNASNCPKLTTVHANSNQLTTLNLSGSTSITSLHCENNQLATLNISALTGLQTLFCNGNDLATLDLSANTQLQTLHFGSNPDITSLDLRQNPNVTELEGNPAYLQTLRANIYGRSQTFAVNGDGYISVTSIAGIVARPNEDAEFSCWTNTADGSATGYSQGIAIPHDKDLDVTANFSPLIVSFNTAGDPESPIQANYNATITLPTPTYLGNYFGGWYTDGSHATRVTSPYTVKKNTTLFALWWPEGPCTISYDTGDGLPIEDLNAMTGDTLASGPPATRTGYTLTGWTADGQPVSFPYTITHDQELTAQWRANTYTVAYNINGGEGGTTASSSHTYDAAKSLTANGYYKAGHVFAGWSSTPTGPVEYSNGQSVTNLTETDGATVTLFAKWNLIQSPYLINIVINGGTLSPVFNPDVNKYTAALDEYTAQFNVDAIKANPLNKVYMNGRLVKTGRLYTLNPGCKRVVTIKVVTPTRKVKYYYVTFTRAKSTDADLASLSASFNSYTIQPAFDKGITNYTLTLPENRRSVAVKVKPDSKYAVVSINGRVAKSRTISLKKGVNTVTIIVKAQAGNMKVYTLTIIRGTPV